MTQNGKGSRPRPFAITDEEFTSNYERTFGKSPDKPSRQVDVNNDGSGSNQATN